MKKLFSLLLLGITGCCAFSQARPRTTADFDANWSFNLGDVPGAESPAFDDSKWRKLDLPHDWSIEGQFSKDHPASPEGGALPGGIGWYRKTFTVPASSKEKNVFIDFDGVYQKSEVWINGHRLGMRPNGYISFRYDLTPYLRFGQPNVIAVKADNSSQPNSRWYSGSGIYRNVWLVTAGRTAIDHWGTFVTSPQVTAQLASVKLQAKISYTGKPKTVTVSSIIYDAAGKQVASASSVVSAGISADERLPNLAVSPSGGISATIAQDFKVKSPVLWSVAHPYLYKMVTKVTDGPALLDEYATPFGIRYFDFNVDKGFSLNGKPMKILGVCEHHDLGSLGAAVNVRALERQLEILKGMGVNGIRTSHNPPTPELLDLCDKMGFVVMDEAFDVWMRQKKRFDYHLFFKEWHKQDLEDQVLRDRNHPSVVMWSIGNEISEQGDTSGYRIAKELAAIVHNLDTTRPITAANNNPDTRNQIIKSGALDLVGYNYHQGEYADFHDRYPGKIFIGTETTSALETRGVYDMPSDSTRRWPVRNRPGQAASTKMNDDFTVSAYDNVSAPWGSTHEETWKVVKKYDFLSGMFIWTGFDYLGEPTPYSWPARSSYFGIIDLAGFPKDVYYMYQSEWTSTPVLHIFPHWNWQPGKIVDVWAYYNQADEVELFLDGRSLGIKKKEGDDLHVMWRVNYVPGTLKAVSRKAGQTVLVREIKTAGPPAKIVLSADRSLVRAGGKDLSFITVKILDKNGNPVPDADNKIDFKLEGDASIAGVDNGDPTSHDPFKASYRKAFHGIALAIVQPGKKAGTITLRATAPGLQSANISITSK